MNNSIILLSVFWSTSISSHRDYEKWKQIGNNSPFVKFARQFIYFAMKARNDHMTCAFNLQVRLVNISLNNLHVTMHTTKQPAYARKTKSLRRTVRLIQLVTLSSQCWSILHNKLSSTFQGINQVLWSTEYISLKARRKFRLSGEVFIEE